MRRWRIWYCCVIMTFSANTDPRTAVAIVWNLVVLLDQQMLREILHNMDSILDYCAAL